MTPKVLDRLRSWYLEPFRVQVHYHEGTRIEHRQFPYRLRIDAVEPLQAALDRVEAGGGGRVTLPKGTQLITRSLEIGPGTVLEWDQPWEPTKAESSGTPKIVIACL